MDASLQDKRRRTWIKALLGTGFTSSLVAFLYPVIRFMLPPPVPESSANEVVAGKITDLRPNSGRIFKFGSQPGLLIRTERGEWRALSAVCTHLNCTVQYRAVEHDIWCACHNGVYNLEGHNVSGPPPRPLEEFEVHIRDNNVVVSRKSRS